VKAWAALAAALLLCGATAHGEPARERTELKAGPGHDLTVGRCVICHSLDYIPANAPAMNRTGWQKTIQKMRERYGAPISDAEAQQILDYLASDYAGKQ
jgi:sulfite dehydrogenase (cytochrome) subunit B